MLLQELLNLPVFAGASVVAGSKGLDHEVNTVNMMDAPDIISYLKQNELLVTTAFHFKDDLSSLLELIKGMQKYGCAGIGIKTKRFLKELPPEAIELANDRNIPIIDIPIDTSLGDIVNQSLSFILDTRTNELHQAMETHQRFTKLIVNGQGLDKILESLALLMDSQVTLLNHQLRPLYGAGAGRESSHSLFTGVSHYLPKSGFITFSLLNEYREAFTLFPVYTHKKQYSYLAVHRFIPPTDRAEILTVEQAANVIAFELMKENALKQKTQRLQNEFFINFVNGTFSSAEEVLNRAKEIGLFGDRRYLCAVGKIDDIEKSLSIMEYQSEKDLILDTIEEEIQASDNKIHLFDADETYILMMEIKGNWSDSEANFLSFLKHVQSAVFPLFNKTISFGISHYAEQFLHIPEAYKEAADALYYGTMLGNKQFIESYQPKEVPEILRMIPHEQLERFYQNTFQALVKEPKKDYDVLMHTLSVYLESHCQLSETAKRLFIHRNTVIYRLEKCEELLGRSLKDPEETLCLRIGFRIKALLQNK